MRKLLSVLLCVSFIFISVAGISASAKESTENFNIFTMESNTTDGFGYSDYRFIDQNGNEISEVNKDLFVPGNNMVSFCIFL